MNSKPRISLLAILAFVLASCGPQPVSPPETALPSPAETAASATPTPIAPVPGGGEAMTIGQEGSGDGEFFNPQGLALDGQGNIYVADTGNARVQMFDAQGQFLAAIADERFIGPRYVAVDETGRIYVTDISEMVHVLNARGEPLQSFGSEGSLPSQFFGIADLAITAAGELYVVDGGNGRVQQFSLLSGFLLSFGSEGSQAELLDRPEGIALDTDGNVYVVDAGNRRIQQYGPGGTWQRSIRVEVSEPRDIAVDRQGNMYVTDGGESLVHVFDRRGALSRKLGEGQVGDPWGIEVDEEGRVYVVDAANHQLHILPPAEEMPTLPTPTAEASPTPSLPPLEGPAPWPMYAGDAQHTGRSLAEGPPSPNLKWMFRSGVLALSPAVGGDGSIYFGSLDGNLYAISADGIEIWRANLGQGTGVPAISEEGVIHVGVTSPVEEMFYALNRDGSIGWVYHVESYVVESSPIIAPDGIIYLAASNPMTAAGAVVALNADGTERWRYDIRSQLPFSPALAPDGTVYVGALDGKLYALNPDGSLRWQAHLGTVTSSAAVDTEGTIYVGTGSSYRALKPSDGSQIWAFSPGYGQADSTPTLGRAGRVYLTSNRNELYTVDSGGALIWTFSAQEEEDKEVHFNSPITLDGARVLYVGTKEGELFAVNPDGSLRWRFPLPEGGAVLIGPAVGSDGTLYVGAGANLYAVGR